MHCSYECAAFHHLFFSVNQHTFIEFWKCWLNKMQMSISISYYYANILKRVPQHCNSNSSITLLNPCRTFVASHLRRQLTQWLNELPPCVHTLFSSSSSLCDVFLRCPFYFLLFRSSCWRDYLAEFWILFKFQTFPFSFFLSANLKLWMDSSGCECTKCTFTWAKRRQSGSLPFCWVLWAFSVFCCT